MGKKILVLGFVFISSLLGAFFMAEPLWAVEPKIAAGWYHTVALKSDGSLWAWGGSYKGQLGDGTNFKRNMPVQVSGGGNTWTTIAAGWHHTVAVKSDGTLWAWGYNFYGQLGDGTTINRNMPVQVSGGGNTWVGIAAGGYHTVALKSDGSLWAWGYNFPGQLGDGTTINRNMPVQVSRGGNTWVGIAAGGYHTVALKSDGTPWAWGLNNYGQLGDGTTFAKHSPVWAGLRRLLADFDGDGKTDVSVYRGSIGTWFVYPSSGASPYGIEWGYWGGDPSDKPVPGDYDGDGKTDYAFYRASTGAWYVKPSSGAPAYGVGWGGDPSDKPVPGDYDGDRLTDIAVYRVSTGAWYVYPSSGSALYGVSWGGDPTDKPVPGDYNGDLRTDIAVYRASTGTWYIQPSSGAAAYAVGWGGSIGDIPVPGDYDGDVKTDIAIYRPTNGGWYIIPSSGAAPYGVGWGGDPTDVPLTYLPAID